MIQPAEQILDHKYFVPNLPPVGQKNLSKCWDILRNFSFIGGAVYSIGAITSPHFRAWRISLRTFNSNEGEQEEYSNEEFDEFLGMIPPPKKHFNNDLKTYLKNIFPEEFTPMHVDVCSFFDSEAKKYDRLWVFNLKQKKLSKEKRSELIPDYSKKRASEANKEAKNRSASYRPRIIKKVKKIIKCECSAKDDITSTSSKISDSEIKRKIKNIKCEPATSTLWKVSESEIKRKIKNIKCEPATSTSSKISESKIKRKIKNIKCEPVASTSSNNNKKKKTKKAKVQQ